MIWYTKSNLLGSFLELVSSSDLIWHVYRFCAGVGFGSGTEECNIVRSLFITQESISKLLGTLCEKRHDAVVVMDKKYFITLISVHIAVIALVGRIFTHLRLVKIPCPLVQ